MFVLHVAAPEVQPAEEEEKFKPTEKQRQFAMVVRDCVMRGVRTTRDDGEDEWVRLTTFPGWKEQFRNTHGESVRLAEWERWNATPGFVEWFRRTVMPPILPAEQAIAEALAERGRIERVASPDAAVARQAGADILRDAKKVAPKESPTANRSAVLERIRGGNK